MKEVSKEEVRPCAVAGMFYPEDPSELEKDIDEMLDSSEPVDIKGRISALVSPHAGYMYSGRIAARGYKQVKVVEDLVVAVISPSHREYFSGISVFNGKAYETPLGLVPVASVLADALISEHNSIRSSWAGHLNEHALEVQLPFLQKHLRQFSIIPIVMGKQDFETCQILGTALSRILKDVPSLIIASSDLSHYHPYHEATEIDGLTIGLIEAFDEIELMHALESGTCEACGGGPIVAAMIASKAAGANKSLSLQYSNSGDVTGDFSAVVGYLSAAFYKS